MVKDVYHVTATPPVYFCDDLLLASVRLRMEIWSFWQMPKGPAHILNCNVGPREEINLLAMHNKAILSIGYTVRQEQEVAPTIVSSPHPFDWIHVMSEVKMKLRHKEQSSN